MLNIIRGDLYRLKKSKSFIVCLAIILAITVLSYFTMEWAIKIASEEALNTSDVITIDVIEELTELTSADLISSVISSEYTSIVFAIFVCIWVTSEFTCGAAKNTVGKGCSRVRIFFAKYITSVGIVFLMNIISFIIMLVSGIIISGTSGLNGEFFIEVLKYILMKLVLLSAYVGAITAVCELTRSLVAGIVISVVFEMFSVKLANGIDLLLDLVGLDFEVSEYWITTTMYECYYGAISTDFVLRAVIVTAIWLTISLAAGLLHFKKADIK